MEELTISQYLLLCLNELGVEDVFGVAGDFVLGFLNKVEKSKIRFIPTTNELNAAYAADGYARVKGIGACITTHAVGELSAVNGVAGSFAERIPVIMIVGTPTLEIQKMQKPLHHFLGDYSIPSKMYHNITLASTILNNPETAADEIDRVLKICLEQKGPVYINIPGDMVNVKCEGRRKDSILQQLKEKEPEEEILSEDVLEEAVKEAIEMLENSKRPVVLVDVGVRQMNHDGQVRSFVDQTGIPYATTLMGKSILPENHASFLGVYQGDRSKHFVLDMVENSDCILHLGAFVTDFNTGGFSTKIPTTVLIKTKEKNIYIKHHVYEGVSLSPFLGRLAERIKNISGRERWRIGVEMSGKEREERGLCHRRKEGLCMDAGEEGGHLLKHNDLYDRICNFMCKNCLVVSDLGDILFSLAETELPECATFISQSFYGSIGWSMGASLGALIASEKTKKRDTLVFVGDGAFQMTCQELSTLLRYNLSPIIFLINNGGYLTERAIYDGPYNDIHNWRYYLLPLVFEGKSEEDRLKEKGEMVLGKEISTSHFITADVRTLGDLIRTLHLFNKEENKNKLRFAEIHLGKYDGSPSLWAAGKSMRTTNKVEA